MTDAAKLKKLTSDLESIGHNQSLNQDALLLSLASLKRIATGNTPDPRLDASNALRGVMMLLAEISV